MTRVTQKEAVLSVSSDVNFVSGKFPDYKIGPDNIIIEPEEDNKVPSLKEIVAKETALLIDQQKRLSVRDLAKKFENGLAAANNLSDEDKWKEMASLDRHVLLKKLRDVLESLRGRVAGRNMDDADEAISMVEALAVQLTQREGELLHEKAEVKKLANFLKQALEDAKKAVEEERALACAEIENARAAIQRDFRNNFPKPQRCRKMADCWAQNHLIVGNPSPTLECDSDFVTDHQKLLQVGNPKHTTNPRNNSLYR